MKITVDVRGISAVLTHGGWMSVDKHSFEIGPFGYAGGKGIVNDESEPEQRFGARWRQPSDGTYIACPLSSILAVRTAPPK